MITNYLKAALRTLKREKTNTLINIAGLTLGITGSLVLFLFVKEGSSYDNYHSKKDRIYRVVSKGKGNNGDTFTQGIPTVLPAAFKDDFTAVEEVALTSYRRNNLIAISQPDGDFKKYDEPKGVAFTQSSFFKIFDRAILSGSVAKLDEPNQVFISKNWALKYFKKENVVGEIVKYENIEYKIAAVMEDYPANTDLPFDLIFSYVTIKRDLDHRGWQSISDSDNCYFLLKENASVNNIETLLPGFVDKHYGKEENEVQKNALIIQPLATLHTDRRFGNYNKKMPLEGKIAFSVIAVFLLLTCCINFINLTTAVAIKRTKEVGIRKILGSNRKQLIMLLTGEAFIVTIISVLISLATAQVLLGFLNPYMDMSVILQLSSRDVWIFLALVTVSVSLLSGLYPAVKISAAKPALALKNQLSNATSSGFAMRKSLVVFQFFISQLFIITTIVMIRQYDHFQNHNVGFAKDAIITIPIPSGDTTSNSTRSFKLHTLKNEIKQLAGIENVSLNLAPPSHKSVLGSSFTLPDKPDEFNTQVKQVDGDYLELYKIQILAGKPLRDLDTMAEVVVNEKFVKVAGFASNADIIGKEIVFWDKRLPVTAVVKDFNTMSLNEPIEPVILFNDVNAYHSISVKLNPSDMQATLKGIQTRWEAAYPEYIFSYEFMDEQVRNLYQGDRRSSAMLSFFACVAVFIGCLGLFGLVTYMANQKTKEIGVRKVLGASAKSIVILFSKEFVKLILIGFVLSAPLAAFILDKILQHIAYRIELGPSIFIISLSVTFLIAFLTVGYRSVKASLVNPVDSLRSE